jgi:hypothetical protein
MTNATLLALHSAARVALFVGRDSAVAESP